MSGSLEGRPDRNRSDNTLQDLPTDPKIAKAGASTARQSHLEVLVRPASAHPTAPVANRGGNDHSPEPGQRGIAPSSPGPAYGPVVRGPTGSATCNRPVYARAFRPNPPPLPGAERQHLLFSLVVVLFVVISAAALLAPVLVIVSPQPLRDFAEDAMVKAATILEGAKAASHRNHTGHVGPEQDSPRSAKLVTSGERERNLALSARLAAAAEHRRLVALAAQRAFAAERRRLAALAADADKAQRQKTAREQRLVAEAEKRRLAALEAQRTFAGERRRGKPSGSQHDAEPAVRGHSAASDITVTFAATRRTVTRHDILFKPLTQRPVRAVGEVVPHAPSLIIQAGDVLASTQILIGRPMARARKKLANGFVLTSTIKRQALKSAWQDIVSRRVTGNPHSLRRARTWFAIAWRDATDSHYVLAIASRNNVASLHIKSPLNNRKALSRDEQRAVTRIACATSFGDVSMPCAQQ